MAVTAFAPRTLAVYQVRLFFPGAPENKIGPAVGSLGSAFNFAQLATSFLYGWISDVTGRPKLLIMLANVACGLGATFFALATSYPGAMISRVVAGAFMTSGVVMKGERVVVVSLGANTGVGKLVLRQVLSAGCCSTPLWSHQTDPFPTPQLSSA